MNYIYYIGLGGNLGDPQAQMKAALQLLNDNKAVEVLATSKLYKTPPWGKLDQPDFLNACAMLKSDLPPDALLSLCLDSERALKRQRKERWGPRSIDLDVLIWSGGEHVSESLTVPHPRLTERAFVLLPLIDLDESLMVGERNLADWKSDLDISGIEVIADQSWSGFQL